MSALEASLLRLAHAVGEPQRELTILAEGNVSARLDDERMLVKATGSSLAASGPDDLVECRFEPILELLDDPTAFEGGAGDARVAQALMDARVDPAAKRPSVEALLHAVVLTSGAEAACHTHPVAANALLCSDRAELLVAGALFPDQVVVLGTRSLLVPYVDPGLGLGRLMRHELRGFADRHGALPKVAWLQNHGIFAIGASPAECLRITEMADKFARILLGALAAGEPRFLPDDVLDRIDGRDDEHVRRAILDAAH
ncbi:rhamnose utilization protein RhaD (predicted bifunctional aldolase and dehydrogenase) [Agrococcus sp. UYP10]|uniref:class II aldolase/adducin family protein n=1 Tax=Agrococcus sp. UYP10 TaxID=1756355 RepID=UPI0033924E9A